MTDFLENTIREQRDDFDEEPLDGHFDRFKEKLEKASARNRKQPLKYYLQIAAVVLIMLLAGNQIRMYLDQKESPATLSSVSPEYSEVEFYYTSAISQGLSECKNLSSEGLLSGTDQEAITKEMKEFDQTYARLQKELEASPGDKRVINAMLEVYQAKLNIITMIINKLESVKKQKEKNDEHKI